jgi:hypothetical protein
MSYDDFEYPPSVSKFTAWVIGMVTPIWILVYAIAGMAKGEFHWSQKGCSSPLVFHGSLALWLGATYLSVAALLHFQFYWGSEAKLFRYRYPLVVFSLAAICLCFAVFLFKLISH